MNNSQVISERAATKDFLTMNTLIKWLEQAGAAIAGACVIAMMFIITADAFCRYLFGSPLPWVIDVVSQYLMVVAIYFAVSETFRRGDHIHLDLFQSRMSRPIRAATGILYSVPAAAVFAIVAFGSMENMIEAYRAGEFIPGYVPWPVWLSYLPIALGSALLTIRLIHHAVMLLIRGEDPDVRLEGENQE